ncbi:MAG: DUF6079 family protein [Pyrinomonadaceae bacterium]
MERITEKVKDFVEVRPFKSLDNLLDEPGETLLHYHFTDGTASMMVQWLNAINPVDGSGACKAIAGHRGVGKSHFLAALGAIMSNPELRTQISDAHVANGAQTLLRRRYPLVNVRRGSGKNLNDELATAVRQAFDLKTEGTDSQALLVEAKLLANDLPILIVVDTAFDREGEVKRNDGKELGELAQYCVSKGIFLALALDDDIAGADGSNVAISNYFSIDYLEQEQLFNVINARIFAKSGRKMSELQAVYERIRAAVPGFSWSEQRFTSLYPIHPVIFEVAPFVRRFAPNFSILRFASATGEKILGRPADSLIGLDELFDETENDLRRNAELESAFEVFDSIRTEVIEKMPVRDRLRQKMILKALLLLSLDGRGSGAERLTASLLLDESETDGRPDSGTAACLSAFAKAKPDGMTVQPTPEGSDIYAIKFGLDELSAELAKRSKNVSSDAVEAALMNELANLFPEFARDSNDLFERRSVPVNLEWRGSIRRGSLVFGRAEATDQTGQPNKGVEWELYYDVEIGSPKSESETTPARIAWKPDSLKEDERQTLLYHSILKSDSDFRETFREHFVISLQAYSEAARRVAERVSVTDARLVIDGFDYNFTDAAKRSVDLGSMMSTMLEPVFEAKFPDHPNFETLLTQEVLDSFVSNIYSGVYEPTSEKAALARAVGVPLGIMITENGSVRKASKDELMGISCVSRLLTAVEAAPQVVVSIEQTAELLRQPPLGHAHESKMLLLLAMASSGLIELVTPQGDRINRRSLDLKIDWTTITSIARPRSASFSKETITKWARVLSANGSIDSLEKPANRRVVLDSLIEISNRWERIDSANRPDRFHEHCLSGKMSRESNRVRANYERVIQDVESALLGNIELEECIGNISEAFGDQAEVFQAADKSASSIACYLSGFSEQERIKDYLARACSTGETEVESARSELKAALAAFESEPSEQLNREFGYAFERFRKKYIDLYISEHTSAYELLKNGRERDNIFSTESWRCFEALKNWKPFREAQLAVINQIGRVVKRPICEMNPERLLETDPICICGYRIGDVNGVERMSAVLETATRFGIDKFRAEVNKSSTAIEDVLRSSNGKMTSEKAADLNALRNFASAEQDQNNLPASDLKHLLERFSSIS